MFDRILASKHSLMDRGNNYLSLMCQRGGGSRLASFDAVKHAPLLNTFVSQNSETVADTEEQQSEGLRWLLTASSAE